MFAGLGAVVAEVADIIKANHIIMLLLFVHLPGSPADFGIQVISIPVPNFQQPSHVIDAGDQLFSTLQPVCHIQFIQQCFRADLHTVAQAHSLDLGVAQHIAGKHGHGIGIVQKPCLRADLLHIPGEFLHHRDGPQGPHNAADAQRVGNGLTQAVFLGDFKINYRTGVISAHLNGIDNK